MMIKIDLWTNPHGRRGGADFDVECVGGVGALTLTWDESQYPAEARSAFAHLAQGLVAYANQPDKELGVLPSAVFRVVILHGDVMASILSAFRLAGCFAASDFHKRIYASTKTAQQ